MRTVRNSILPCLFTAFILTSCLGNREQRKVSGLPPMYPDYTDITIPVNIAPLNFLMPDSASSVVVYVDGERISTNHGNGVTFRQSLWKRLLKEYAGDTIDVVVRATYENCEIEYAPFHWYVVEDKVDAYLTYRLIEPDYEVFSRVSLEERCLENFKTRKFADHETIGNRCMNCHTYANQDSQMSMLYVRGTDGGAVLNQNGSLSLLDINMSGMVSPSVYFGFHPNGRYIVFSSNHIIPAFHSAGSKRLEVFDVASDVYVADLWEHTIHTNNLLADSLWLETFPTFSPDGKSIYFCTAKTVDFPDELDKLQYYLCRIGFDEGRLSEKVDTLHQAGTSVCHPRVSPDGKYLLYTVQAYGTFPIWHREADLRMIDLETGEVDRLDIVNSDRSDTYHSWSSNSRWFVFASKRDDGLYGKPYFCYVDKEGRAHKPFVLPQKSPMFYRNCLKSFNVPELGEGSLPFSSEDISRLIKSGVAEKFSDGQHTPSR